MKKGFTLIELVAVLIVISTLGLIVSLTVSNVLKNNEEKVYEVQVQNIIDGAKAWAGDNVFLLPSNDGDYLIKSLLDLQQAGFLEEEIINPKTNEVFKADEWAVKITKTLNNYKYELIEI